MDEVDSLLNELEGLGDRIPSAPVPRASVTASPRTAASRVYSDGVASPERSPVTQRKSGAPPVWKDSNSKDVNATNCSVCNKRIFLGQDAYVYQNRHHCIDCLCSSCGNPITGQKTSSQESGKNYCENCTCHRCHKGITDKYGRDGQFKVCVSCLCQFCRGPLRSGDNAPYCSACRCVGCATPLEGTYFPGDDGRRYCGNCIQNQSGGQNVSPQQSSQPQASEGNSQARGSTVAPANAARPSGPVLTCQKCSTRINGEFVDCNGNRYHKTCFSCVECGQVGNQLLGDRRDIYCGNCHPDKAICCICRGPLRGGGLEALGRLYHDNCFTCSRCNNVLPGGKFKELDGFVLCTHCAIDVVNRGVTPM